MKHPINITLASDDNYARHMGIVTLSVLANASHPERYMFYYLDAGISEVNRERIESIINRYDASCRFIAPDTSGYGEIPLKRYGVAALFRLSLSTLLPTELERTIYLDCDVLAFDDVEKLWRIDLEGHTVGAVTNLGKQPLERLGITDGAYFNSGVLLIDLQQWRRESVGQETLSYMQQNAEHLVFPDQDGLNRVLQGRWKHLPLRWNQQPASYSMLEKGKTQPSLTREQLREAVTTPGIVHYLGKNKPWNYMTFHPLKENYWGYIGQSPWKGASPAHRQLKDRLKKALLLEKNLKHLLRRQKTPTATRMRGL
ncbi:MAG: glycosyltransferase family 8 protein [Pseudomonadota bacterium]